VTEALRDRLVSMTRDLILIPSTGSQPDEIERCLSFLRTQLETVEGLRIDEHTCDGVPSLVAMARGVERPDVLLLGHLDVIEHPELPSYRSHIEDGRVYGPGAGDMKGALAIMVSLFIDLHDRHPDLSLGIALTSDEERGGHCGMRHLIEDVGLRCGMGILPDGGSLTEVAVAEKGLLHLRLRAHGHSGHAAYPWQSDNPVDRLLDGLQALRGRFRRLCDNGGADRWHPTCTITVVSTEGTTVNRIHDHADALLDVRFTPPWTLQSMLEEVRTTVAEWDLQPELLVGDEPTQLHVDDAYAQAAAAELGQPPQRIRVSGGSDARFLARAGIPTLVTRPDVGDLHGEREWIEIESMQVFYRILERYITQRLGI
jgi:succinyl-diaminopimelate desuccinylase